MTHKEELQKKFDDFIDKNNDIVAVIDSYDSELIFNFFYSEIEARDKQIKSLINTSRGFENAVYEEMKNSALIEAHYASQGMGLYPKEVYAKTSHLESLVKEADGIVRQYEMGDLSQVELCIKQYNQLKTKSQS